VQFIQNRENNIRQLYRGQVDPTAIACRVEYPLVHDRFICPSRVYEICICPPLNHYFQSQVTRILREPISFLFLKPPLGDGISGTNVNGKRRLVILHLEFISRVHRMIVCLTWAICSHQLQVYRLGLYQDPVDLNLM